MRLAKNRIILIIVNAFLLIAFIICLIASASIRNTLRSQQAATAWAGQSGERFAQLSAFLPEGTSFDEISIRSLRESIDKVLIDASLDTDPGRILYTDAWAALGQVSIVGDRGSANAQAFGVGGDFFLFHPLYLRDGSYLSPRDLMKDRIVLDEELAWRLFGSVNLAGLDAMIGDRPFLIAGVISRENDFASNRAYTGGAGLFMSYEALSQLIGSNAEIICYEIVLPDPISGFALKTFSDIFPDKDAPIIENSARYTLSAILDVILSFGERSMRAEGITYPYWENAARYTEDWLALLLVFSALSVLCPAVFSVIYGIKGIRFLASGGKRTLSRRIEQRDERKAEEYRLAHVDEIVIPDIEQIIREVQEEREAEAREAEEMASS